MKPDTYLTIKAFSQGLYKEKGSRFIAQAWPVTTQEEIKSILDSIRKEHHSAKHHCFAWMLGQDRKTFRVNDDGEPSGSAGKPILGQINSYNLTNILIVVVRYFGGKLLGVSGLINAYRSASESALKNAGIIELCNKDYYELRFPYSAINDVMKVIKDEEAGQSEQIIELECRIIINFRTSSRERILNSLSRIGGLRYSHKGTF
ncbi:MAG TPA: YigZ family protein [Bacteroidales bacterium]|nr:YigZ family protein [Bacteroidales bacterium]